YKPELRSHTTPPLGEFSLITSAAYCNIQLLSYQVRHGAVLAEWLRLFSSQHP
ncbi:hypothetical protein O181_049786, partial [Austropuccinia psidii MF-1]|nr:hypothetical protein [Austropuccinia psidii MF-1]